MTGPRGARRRPLELVVSSTTASIDEGACAGNPQAIDDLVADAQTG